MSRVSLYCMPLLLLFVAPAWADAPSMRQVIAAPADYAGQSITFPQITLSGEITWYEVNYMRKYYLTVASRRGALQPGFFLAPPSLADKLGSRMKAGQNYWVNLTCRIERIVINEVPQWHGIVTRIEFLDRNGRVTDTVKLRSR